MPSVVLINDTSLFNTHFGCQLVGQTFREQLTRVGVNLIAAFPTSFDVERARKYLNAADLVIINAEGSIHHGRNVGLLELANEYPCALINGVFEDNGLQSSLKNFLYISMRESLSAGEIHRQGAECDVVPDLIFASMFLSATPRPYADLPVGFTDNVTNPMSGFSPKSELTFESVQKIARCKTICAGRFHAAVAAAVFRIPFSSWDSNTWKTRGMMNDMGMGHLHFETQTEAMKNVPSDFDPRIDLFVSNAQSKIVAMFDQLASLAGRSAISKAA